MLQAHSLLWNYLWIAPNLVFLVVGFLLWKRGLAHQVPVFLAFSIITGLGELAVFGADNAPFVSAPNYWRISWAVLLLQALLKFLVIGEVLSKLLAPYSSVSRLGRTIVSGFGAVLVLLAGVVAGFAHGDNPYRLISGFHLLEQTVFVIQLGLIVFLFLFAAYFHLSWDRLSFGILLGLGISSCEHLATWAIIANISPSEHVRTLIAFLNMAAYHVAVLVWIYYLAFPGKPPKDPTIRLPETDLAVWNREVERLLHQ